MSDLLTREQIAELIERSKDDRAIIVGSEVRQLAAMALRALKSEPEGWVSAPKEPTPAMCQAGYAALRKNATAEQLMGMTTDAEIYKAMIDARPRATELSVGQDAP